jgi:hypothetical protein
MSRMRAWAMRSSSLDGCSSSALRSIDSVGSISRRRRSAARVRKTSQASAGASKYSRRSPGKWRSFTSRQACSSFRPMLTLLRLNSSLLGDVVGMHRRRRDKDQRIDLPHRAVDAPAAAHLTEVADKAADER